ncbi:MAG: succinate dehydrogenase assembly factor 2 [Alphaproteobacteria bacterium]|nr:succinate dehydrogenase assembly factor 2 [Alphaproteobacteria bacterium]
MEKRIKRLKFRAWHRGTKESDLLLGRFADRYLETLDPTQLDRFEALLEESDPELVDWFTGRVPVRADLDHDVMGLLRAFTLAGGGA